MSIPIRLLLLFYKDGIFSYLSVILDNVIRGCGWVPQKILKSTDLCWVSKIFILWVNIYFAVFSFSVPINTVFLTIIYFYVVLLSLIFLEMLNTTWNKSLLCSFFFANLGITPFQLRKLSQRYAFHVWS